MVESWMVSHVLGQSGVVLFLEDVEQSPWMLQFVSTQCMFSDHHRYVRESQTWQRRIGGSFLWHFGFLTSSLWCAPLFESDVIVNYCTSTSLVKSNFVNFFRGYIWKYEGTKKSKIAKMMSHPWNTNFWGNEDESSKQKCIFFMSRRAVQIKGVDPEETNTLLHNQLAKIALNVCSIFLRKLCATLQWAASPRFLKNPP